MQYGKLHKGFNRKIAEIGQYDELWSPRTLGDPSKDNTPTPKNGGTAKRKDLREGSL